ncbi:MAG: hypothetical protein SO170_03705 [Butyribacter sp.]|nr:hypothetical protein [bacterium]MDY3854059.1 hypothetical protein [Butyribacter sp.]
MKQSKNTSFSLLSQDEIDTLVRFLTDKKNTVNSDVMSQSSIDKLIRLIKTDGDHLVLNSSTSYGNVDPTFLQKLHFRASEDELCILRHAINADNNYIELFIDNKETGETLQLSPKLFNEADSEDWGYAVAPTLFNHLACMLTLRFSQETYDAICSLYAKQIFGSEDHKLPELYLPENSILVECLL